MVVAPSHSASLDTLEILPEASLSSETALDSLASTLEYTSYQIEDTQQSECARVLFTRHAPTGGRLVIKVLCEYKDTRYSLETVDKRQQCQLEALQQNRAFTPEVYVGLARIEKFDLTEKRIFIGELIECPTKEMLEPGAEYALVMRMLPENRRLDCLLKEKEEGVLRNYVQLLSKRLTFMHRHLAPPTPEVDDDGEQWGSYKQLEKKLLHNFGLLDLILDKKLENRLTSLKETLNQIFTQSYYKRFFGQRIIEYRIKRCHGDLKAPNIWIAAKDQRHEQEEWRRVSILDGADFNQSYTNIDVLSDIAMLVVDIQARTRSARFADILIKTYLRDTCQQDEVSTAVLAFYLVEKAIVGAAVSIVYDNLLDLGWAYLETAEMRLNNLLLMQPQSHEIVLESSGSSRSM